MGLLALAAAGCDSKLKTCEKDCLEQHQHAVARCVGPGAETCKSAMHKKTSSCMMGCKAAAGGGS